MKGTLHHIQHRAIIVIRFIVLLILVVKWHSVFILQLDHRWIVYVAVGAHVSCAEQLLRAMTTPAL